VPIGPLVILEMVRTVCIEILDEQGGSLEHDLQPANLGWSLSCKQEVHGRMGVLADC
jgi:hypothetical protein